MSLLNKKAVKQFTIEYVKTNRPKFTRVSNDFLIYIEGVVKEKIKNYVHTLPSVGKTIKSLVFLTLLCGYANAQDGFATYYTHESTGAEGNSGMWTASGAAYDEKAMTCAMRRRDWGSHFLVYGQATGKSAVVKLTDFGPGKGPSKRGTIIDLTPAAFKEVCGKLSIGKCFVSVQEVAE